MHNISIGCTRPFRQGTAIRRARIKDTVPHVQAFHQVQEWPNWVTHSQWCTNASRRQLDNYRGCPPALAPTILYSLKNRLVTSPPYAFHSGLFHRVLSLSGSPLNPWALYTNNHRFLLILANYIRCPAHDPSVLIKCLQEIDQDEVLEAAQLVMEVSSAGDPPVAISFFHWVLRMMQCYFCPSLVLFFLYCIILFTAVFHWPFRLIW